MRISDHFRNDVLKNPKRVGITVGLCEEIVRRAEHTEQQSDGLWRIWGYVPEMDRWIRVVTSADRGTLITAYKDRNFTREMRRRRG